MNSISAGPGWAMAARTAGSASARSVTRQVAMPYASAIFWKFGVPGARSTAT